MAPRIAPLVLPAIALLAVGCRPRVKSWESFVSATTPNPPATWRGDPHSAAGSADPSGGLKPQTNYGAGANPNSPVPLDPQYDQPAMGSGQQPGEYPGEAAPGFGNSNAPALQPSPGAADPAASRFSRG